jgi:hypothetical protein
MDGPRAVPHRRAMRTHPEPDLRPALRTMPPYPVVVVCVVVFLIAALAGVLLNFKWE